METRLASLPPSEPDRSLGLQAGDTGPTWEPGVVPERLEGALYRSPLIEVSRNLALFRFGNVGRFLVKADGPVLVERVPEASDEDVQCMLRGPVAALRCCLEGQFCLRGSAVEIGGQAVVFSGTARGTSTAAAGLALGGGRMVADGVVVISGTPLAASPASQSGAALVTLWPDAVEALGLDASAGRLVRPSLASRLFAIGPQFGPRSVTVGALCAIVVDPRSRASGIMIEPMNPRRRVAALLDAEWHSPVVRALGLEGEHFRWVADVTSSVPMFVARRPPRALGTTLTEFFDRVRQALL